MSTIESGQRQAGMTHDDIIEKYYRGADYMQVSKSDATKIHDEWMNLQSANDVATTLKSLAKFGQPRAL